MVQIVPAILATTEEEYQKKLLEIEQSNLFEGGWVQIDIMDNKFVQNKSIGSDIIAKYPTNLQREAHLMVEYPDSWIDELVKIGVGRIIFPVEGIEGVREKIAHIKNHGIQVGLSLNPQTSTKEIEQYLTDIDSCLIMSVNPGFSGQEFIPTVLVKIKELKSLKMDLIIGVDGGVSFENAKIIKEAGADYLVVGSHLLEGNIEENLEAIWEKLQG